MTKMLEIRNRFEQSTDCLCGLCHVCVLNCGLGVVRPKNSHGFLFHKVEPMLGERAAHEQPPAQFWTIKNSPGLLVGPCVNCMNLLKNEWLELCGKQYVNA